MKPSTSPGVRSNVGIAKPSPAVRQTGNMRCLLVMGGVYRSSVPRGGTQVKYRCRCRVTQGDLGGQPRLQPAEFMRPLSVEAEGMRELLLHRLHALAHPSHPAPEPLGPRRSALAL